MTMQSSIKTRQHKYVNPCKTKVMSLAKTLGLLLALIGRRVNLNCPRRVIKAVLLLSSSAASGSWKKTVTLVDRRKVDGATERIKTIRNTRQRKLVFYRDLIHFPEIDRYTWYGGILFLTSTMFAAHGELQGSQMPASTRRLIESSMTSK